MNTTQQKIMLLPVYSVHRRVKVLNTDDIWNDLTDLEGYDMVQNISWNENIDSHLCQATITLSRERYFLSLAPLAQKSKWNINGSGSYSPTIDLNFEITFEVACVPDGIDPVESDWILVFHGKIDDIDWGKSYSISISARDLGGDLVDTMIEQQRTYGSDPGTAVETIIQSILDDNMGAGVVPLYAPVSPAWDVKPYTQKKESVMDALSDIVMQFGWDIRYVYDEISGDFRLSLVNPGRYDGTNQLTSVWTFSQDDYFDVQKMAVSKSAIRNVIAAVWKDANNGNARTITTYPDNPGSDPSVLKYGRRFMQLAEDSTANILTLTDAQNLVKLAYDDLSEPKATQQIELRFFPFVQLRDYLTFEANDVHYSVDQNLAVVSYTHSITDDGKAITTLTTRGMPAGAHRMWLERDTRRGVAVAADFAGPFAPTNLVGTFTGLNAIFAWDKSVDSDYARAKIEIYVGGTLKRTEIVDTNHYEYTYDKNVEDNTNAAPDVVAQVYYLDNKNNESSAAVLEVTNPPPPVPTDFTFASTLSTLQFAVSDPDIQDFAAVEFEAATQPDYSDARVVYSGHSFSGVAVPILTSSTNYGRVRFKDKFGQYSSSYATSNTEAKLISASDMDGAIFDIQPSATLTPTSGTLTDLWDGQTGTGPAFSGPVTVTFLYPMSWFFDMVRFYPSVACSFYVEAYSDSSQTWVAVCGSSSSQKNAAANAWNIFEFDSGKKVVSKQLRITFNSALTLYELKFWTITLADEILAQVLTLTSGMSIETENGQLVINGTGITATDTNGNLMYQLVLSAGSGFFKGSVTAGELILPVGSI